MKISRIVWLFTVTVLVPVCAFSGELQYEHAPPSKRSAALKNVLLPGLGQIEQGRSGRGVFWAGGAIVLGVGTYFSHSEYHSAARDLENAEDDRAGLEDEAVSVLGDLHHVRVPGVRVRRRLQQHRRLAFVGDGVADAHDRRDRVEQPPDAAGRRAARAGANHVEDGAGVLASSAGRRAADHAVLGKPRREEVRETDAPDLPRGHVAAGQRHRREVRSAPEVRGVCARDRQGNRR